MQEDLNNQNSNDLEENLPMVNYIMLHRIYDMLSLIAKGYCILQNKLVAISSDNKNAIGVDNSF